MAVVQDILDGKGTHVVKVDRAGNVTDAARLMKENRIGALVVCDGEKVVGVFTERDVLGRIVAEGRDPAATEVGDVMTSPVACCCPETDLEECRAVMTEKRVRHLPVVDRNHLLGMITSGDIMAHEKTARGETIQFLKEYIYGPYAAAGDRARSS